jgi:hypothetical protein
MKTRTNLVKTMATVISCLALSAVAGTASAAPGGSFDSTRLPAQTRTELRTSIDKARATDPAAFHEVRDMFAKAHAADLHARGRKAPNSMRLAALGSKALLPMLELVAFDAPPLAKDEKPADRASVNRDLIEAIGLLRDARAMPVLVAILARESDAATTRTTAEAIARMDNDEAATTLVAAVSKASGERATAILAGMGACHRAVIARTLADRLAAHPDDAAARPIMKSLGHVGSAWAWKTLADRSDEAASRETAARALVAAYVQYTGEARDGAAKALLVVDDSHTEALIEAARRGASPDVALALDDLARRFASNPTR